MLSKQVYRGFDFNSCVNSIALAALGSLVMHAQTQTPSLEASVPHGATVRGTVFDPAGLPVSKALISVLSPISGSLRTAQTEPSGAFSMEHLGSGTYSLNVASSGFTIELRTVTVHDGEVLDLGKVRLRLSSASQQVTVVSGSRLAELEDDSPSKVLAITKQQIQNTGYERLADVLGEVPGINTQTQSYGVGIVGGQRDAVSAALAVGSISKVRYCSCRRCLAPVNCRTAVGTGAGTEDGGSASRKRATLPENGREHTLDSVDVRSARLRNIFE